MSLTSAAYFSRKAIKYGSIGLISLAIIWPVSTAIIRSYKAAHPPYVPPTLRYGILPRISFLQKQFEKKNFTFELPGDVIPKFPNQAKIYVIYRPSSSFLALEYYTKTANDLGFSSKPIEISPSIYQFKNDTLNQTLVMNVLDGSFKIQYPYLTDQTLLSPERMPDKNQAIDIASSFLERGDKYPSDIENGEKTVTFWKIAFDGLKPVASQSEANAVRVDFFRQELEKGLKIVSTDPNKASISVLISGSTVQAKQIIEVNYQYVNVDKESFSTYPIKTADQAMNDLKIGNYWPASDVASKDVVIRKISLAYFEPITLTNFLQPVFVFEGDNNFIAYVPAVLDRYTK